MLVKIKCELSEVFYLPQITTEKGNKLKFTKGVLETNLDEENFGKLEKFAAPYGDYIEVFSKKKAEELNDDKIVNELNKKTESEEKKAKLYRELEEFKSNEKLTKKEVIKRFEAYINDKNATKEEIITQIEANIEKIEA